MTFLDELWTNYSRLIFLTDCGNELEFFVADEIAREFGVENIHVDIVVIMAIDEELVTSAAVFLKTDFFVTATGALVARENTETDAVEVEIFETIFENQIDSFGAVAMVMKIRVTDVNAKHGGTGGEIELVETDGANHLILIFGHNAEIAAALVVG